MPGLPARRLDQNVDIEFTLRRVFGKNSFRSVLTTNEQGKDDVLI